MLKVSTNGTDWTEYDISGITELGDYNTGSDLDVSINISGAIADNPSHVKVRWCFQAASHYVVAFDDLAFIENNADDLVLSQVGAMFYSGGYDYLTPKGHLTKVSFGAKIHNNGSADQNDVQLNAIVNTSGSEVYNQIKDTVIISANSIDSLAIDSSFYLDDAHVLTDINDEYEDATYQAIFNVSADGITDAIPEDNSDTLYFGITEKTFQHVHKIVDTFDFEGYSCNSGDFWGNNFLVMEDDTAGSVDIYLGEGTSAGITLIGCILKYDGSDWIKIIESAEYDVVASDIGTWVNLQFEDVTGSDLLIDGYNTTYDQYYKVGAEFYFAADQEIFLGTGETDEIPHDHSAESTYTDYTTMYTITDNIPAVRFNLFRTPSGINDVENTINVQLYPNPTNGNVTLTNVEDATITVYSLIGEVLLVVNSSTNDTNIDMSLFENGTYIVKIENDKGVATKKLNLLK